MLHRPRRTLDRGSASLETIIVAAGLMLFIGVIVFAGRTALAQQAVDAAAADGARAASIARTSGEARSRADATAANTLSNQNLACSSRSVSIDTSGFSRPVGTPATVAATVTCRVQLSDLFVPGVPGSKTVTATATSPLDTYRERG